MFADGSAQLREASASLPFNVPRAIVPLDSVLQSRFVDRRPGGAFGARVSRSLTARFSAELSVDYAWAPLAIDSDALTGLELTRVTFENTFHGLLAGPAARMQTVTATSTLDERRGHQFTSTGALLIAITTRSRLVPYAVAGGGIITNRGGTPSAHVTGQYQFTFPPVPVPAPIVIPTTLVNEADEVRVRAAADTRFALALGGGVKYPIRGRLGLRIDLRDHIYRDAMSTRLDATPATQLGPGALTLGTVPRLTFGGSTFIRSTLSGPAIHDFETFRATGLQHQINLAAGLFWRF
jgi:hypothetical protein